MTARKKTVKKTKAWADVGSNGGIFYFAGGPVASRYPSLLQVYQEKITDDLVPVWIISRAVRPKERQ